MSNAAKEYLTQFQFRMARGGVPVRLSLKKGLAVWGDSRTDSRMRVRDLPDGSLLAETRTVVRGSRV